MSYLLATDIDETYRLRARAGDNPGATGIVLKPNREARRLLRNISPDEAKRIRQKCVDCRVVVRFVEDAKLNPYRAPELNKPDGYALIVIDADGNESGFSAGRFETDLDAEHYLWKYGIERGAPVKP